MGGLLGCFQGRKKKSSSPRKYKFFSSSRKALQKVSSRRDKAQVLPHTSLSPPGDHKTKPGDFKKLSEDAKAREEAHEYVTRELKRIFSSPSNAETRPTFSREQEENGASETVGVNLHEAGACQLNKKEYINIGAVFPESLFTSNEHQKLSESRSSDSDENLLCMSSEKKSQMSFDEKPILGLVPAEWPEVESEVKSFRSWDGNGIPNSTTKYKEDQMVNFQTTSFEARLERALATQG